MQNRYAGDIGDFGKLALLRALAPGRRLGVCWYLSDGKREPSNDGRHLGYLEQPDRFRDLDAPLFDALRLFVTGLDSGRYRRSVLALEQLRLLPESTLFHRDQVPRIPTERTSWSSEMVEAMHGADLVFLDPDNGVENTRLTQKSAALAELRALRTPGRVLLLYHHQTRRRGGARADAKQVASCLRACGFQSVSAIRLKPYSSRFFFLLDADTALHHRLAEFAAAWRAEAESFIL